MLNIGIRSRKTNKELVNFLKICNELLPITTQEAFVKLVNFVEEYLKSIGSTLRSYEEIIKDICNDEENAAISKIKAEDAKILTNIREIVKKETLSLEDYKSLFSLVQLGLKNQTELIQQKNKINAAPETTNAKKELSKEVYVGASRLVFDLEKTLLLVASLNTNESSKIKNVKITEKQIDEINKLKITSESKEKAKELLSEFLRTRKNAYEIIEIFAYNVVDKYKQKQVDFDEGLYIKYQLSVKVLEALDMENKVFEKDEFNIEKNQQIQNSLILSKLYNAYMVNEQLDKKLLDDASKIKDYEYSNVVTYLIKLINR